MDPKDDLTFKKVFGEHQDLVISFLNALLPFENEDEKIVSVEYLSPEHVSFNPLRGDSVLCVSCGDMSGRRYIVEIQVMWTRQCVMRIMRRYVRSSVYSGNTGNVDSGV